MSFITQPGVVGFSNLQNTTAPNNVIPVSYFAGSGVAVNVDVAFVPKGTGSILADIPDGTAAGGDKRGTNSVDLQSNRTNSTQVAQSNQSVISGGFANTAGGVQSVVAGGGSNQANGQTSAVGGGTLNIAAGQGACIPGGEGNQAAGADSIAVGSLATTRTITAALAHGAPLLNLGTCQVAEYVLGVQTGAAAPTVLRSNNLVAQATNQVVLPNNSVYRFTADVVGVDLANNDYRVSTFSGLILRGANAAATVMPVGGAETVIGSAGGGAGWVVAVAADVALGCLNITVTGAVGRNINWSAKVSTTEATP